MFNRKRIKTICTFVKWLCIFCGFCITIFLYNMAHRAVSLRRRSLAFYFRLNAHPAQSIAKRFPRNGPCRICKIFFLLFFFQKNLSLVLLLTTESLFFELRVHSKIRKSVNSIFTALHVIQTRYSDENSVRPSVCLSFCDKTEERSVQIFLPYER